MLLNLNNYANTVVIQYSITVTDNLFANFNNLFLTGRMINIFSCTTKLLMGVGQKYKFIVMV